MADSTSHLKLYGTAMYGSFEVLVGDIHRPLISEGALTSKPHNLSIVKSGNYAWIIDPAKTPSGFCAIEQKRVIIYITFMIHLSCDSIKYLCQLVMDSSNPL